MANSKFETSLKDLEKIVRKLEGGELTLEESLKAYEDGIRLARQCEKILQGAKGKIEQLTTSFTSNEQRSTNNDD